MAVKNLDKKLKALAKPASKQALDASQWRKDNRDWLRKSFEISLHVLLAIKAKGWNQKQLAEAMDVSPQQVSKILKGKENFTLQTISALERILETELVKTAFSIGNEVKHMEMDEIPNVEFQTALSKVFVGAPQRLRADGELIKAPKWTPKAENYLRVA